MTEKRSEDFSPKRGPLGDARPDHEKHNTRTGGSLPQEKVEDRDNVSIVTPEDYPAEDRALSRPD